MYRVPRYSNAPLTYVLRMECDELLIGFLGLFYAIIVKHLLVVLVTIGLTYCYIRVKREHPPGFFKHAMYMVSMFELDHYPDCQRQVFIE